MLSTKLDSEINVKLEFREGEGIVTLDNIAKRAAAYKPKEKAEAIKDALKYFEVI